MKQTTGNLWQSWVLQTHKAVMALESGCRDRHGASGHLLGDLGLLPLEDNIGRALLRPVGGQVPQRRLLRSTHPFGYCRDPFIEHLAGTTGKQVDAASANA